MSKKIFSAVGSALTFGGAGLASSIIGGGKSKVAEPTAATPAVKGPIIKKLGASSSAKPVINRLTGRSTILRDTLGGD
jgi:hypothetical protein